MFSMHECLCHQYCSRWPRRVRARHSGGDLPTVLLKLDKAMPLQQSQRLLQILLRCCLWNASTSMLNDRGEPVCAMVLLTSVPEKGAVKPLLGLLHVVDATHGHLSVDKLRQRAVQPAFNKLTALGQVAVSLHMLTLRHDDCHC